MIRFYCLLKACYVVLLDANPMSKDVRRSAPCRHKIAGVSVGRPSGSRAESSLVSFVLKRWYYAIASVDDDDDGLAGSGPCTVVVVVVVSLRAILRGGRAIGGARTLAPSSTPRW
jgi:hypothetical protein